MKRLDTGHGVRRRRQFYDQSDNDSEEGDSSEEDEDDYNEEGEKAWKNSEGERLRDFGVDEEIEFYDEEDIPLGILMQRQNRKHQ